MYSSYTICDMKELMDPASHTEPYDDLSYTLVRNSYKLLGGDRMTLSYGTDVKIHGAEIHMVCHIKRNPGSHISGIARMIGVSRGAVSQIVKKIEKKGLIRKVANPHNLKQLDLVLTEKGEKAFRGHQQLHQAFTDSLKQVLESYSEEEFALISRFQHELEASIDTMITEVYADDYFEA